MIDIKLILNNPEKVQEKISARGENIDVSEVVSLYNQKKEYGVSEETKRNQLNSLNKEMALLVKEGRKNEFEKNKTILRLLSSEIKDVQKQRNLLEEKIENLLLRIPNLIQNDVPISLNKEDSETIYSFGHKKRTDFPILSHVELSSNKNIIDFKRGAKIASAGFPIYVGKGALLEFALIQYMLNHSVNKGFTMILPPILNNTQSLKNAGNLPKFAEQIYSCADDDLHLIPTAEVPLTNLFANEFVDLEAGPLKYVAYTPNFRREAGSYGKRDKGLMRLHQFNKIETYTICKPEESKKELEELLTNAKSILENLNLHFKVTNLPSCDLAQQSSQTYDLEVWLPHQQIYSEVSSASNCTDYQARRSNIRFKENSKTNYVHTLNCSGLATPRLMIALLESNQTKEGDILIPEPLVKYTGFGKI